MSMYLNEVVRYLATQSWQIALLTMAVAAVAFTLRHRSAHVRYLLWLVVVAKCLVPPLHVVPLQVLPSIPFSGGISSVPSQPQQIGAPSPFTTSALPSISRPLSPEFALSPRVPQVQEYWPSECEWFGGFWIVGAAVYLMMNLLRALRGHYWLHKTRRPFPEDVQADAASLLRAYGVRGVPRIWIMDGVGQPFVWGLLRGSIYVPPGFHAIENPEHRRDILAHEISHVLRFDAAVNALQVVAQGLFWFHPLVWWANQKIHQEREKCCDEMVIARLNTTPQGYSTAIVETLAQTQESAQPVPSLAVASPLEHVEERIKTMLRPGKRFYKRPSLIAAVLVILAALLAVPTAVILTAQPMYVVSGTIHIASRESSLWGSEPKPFDRDAHAVFMQTQAVLLSNDERLLSKVVDDLTGRKLAFLSPAKTSAAREGGFQSPDSILRQAIAEGVIKAAPIPDTELLEVSMVSDNEKEAKTIVNSFLRNYVVQYRVNSDMLDGQNIIELERHQNELQKRILEGRVQLPALTGPDPAQSPSLDVQDRQSRIKLDEEYYEKVSRRLREIDMNRDRRPRVQVAALAEVKGLVDNRGRWALIILGATVVLSSVLLIVGLVVRPRR